MSRTLEITELKVHFPGRGTLVRAVDGVSLSIAPGETLGRVPLLLGQLG